MKKWLLAIVFGSALVLGACGNSDDSDSKKEDNTNTEEASDPSTPGESKVDAGKAEELYASNCASCHGQDLSGGAGPDLHDVGSKMSEDEIKNKIEKGGGGMPGGLVSGDDLDTLASWLAAKK